MENTGQMLKETRERKDITLRDASQITKIGIKFLKALENNEYDVFSDHVYLHYFLKNYANFLGLDGEKMAGEFKPIQFIPLKKQPQERRINDFTKKVIAIFATMLFIWLLWIIYQAVVVKF